MFHLVEGCEGFIRHSGPQGKTKSLVFTKKKIPIYYIKFIMHIKHEGKTIYSGHS